MLLHFEWQLLQFSPFVRPLFSIRIYSSTYLGLPLLKLVVWMLIHTCPWLVLYCPTLPLNFPSPFSLPNGLLQLHCRHSKTTSQIRYIDWYTSLDDVVFIFFFLCITPLWTSLGTARPCLLSQHWIPEWDCLLLPPPSPPTFPPSHHGYFFLRFSTFCSSALSPARPW
jgi:hypothetical protein